LGYSEDLLAADCSFALQVRAAVASAGSSYEAFYHDSFCEDEHSLLWDNHQEEAYKSAPLKYEDRSSCEALCNEDAKCQFMVWGWSPLESYYRCATFESCAMRHVYQDGHPWVFKKRRSI